MKTNHIRGFKARRDRGTTWTHHLGQTLKDASDTNRRAAERQGLDRIRTGADPDAATMPVRDAEVGDPWDWD